MYTLSTDNITIFTIGNVKSELDDILQNAGSVSEISLNLEHVTEIDAAGLQLLVAVSHKLAQ